MIYQIKEDAYGSKDIPVPYTTAHPRCAYYSVGKRVLIKSYTKVVHRVRSSVNVLVAGDRIFKFRVVSRQLPLFF